MDEPPNIRHEVYAAAVEYDRRFYDEQAPLSARSAEVVVPAVVALLDPRSVVDVGCGVGTWLAAFKRCGVRVVRGLDGDYARAAGLLIADDEFTAVDLTQPLPATGRFDLALSLEVGEHLPAAAAEDLVRTITALAPLALFSAAFPGQGGTNHVNEQWPTYWHALFTRRDFVALDPIRPAVWQDERVAWWYRCNTYLYAHRDVLGTHPGLAELARRYEANPLTLTHKRVIRRLAGSGRLAKYRTKLAMRLLG